MFKTDDYRHLTNQILAQVDKKGVESISEYASLTMIPLPCLYEITMDSRPEHKEYCEEKIKEFNKFFGL